MVITSKSSTRPDARLRRVLNIIKAGEKSCRFSFYYCLYCGDIQRQAREGGVPTENLVQAGERFDSWRTCLDIAAVLFPEVQLTDWLPVITYALQSEEVKDVPPFRGQRFYDRIIDKLKADYAEKIAACAQKRQEFARM